MSCWAVIVAAGRGDRAGLGVNKVFFPLRGRSVLGRCLDAIEGSARFDGAVVVLSEVDEARFAELQRAEGPYGIVKRIVRGGKTRRDSVCNGLLALPREAAFVAIHDAARPFVSKNIIDATLDSAKKSGSGVISTPVVDTIKQVGQDGRVSSLDRNALRAVQTPQCFDCQLILKAHLRAREDGLSVTDDAMLFEHYYGDVTLVTTDDAAENIKLTTKKDFEAMEKPVVPEVRVGQGYDAHRLAEGRRLVLCGVEIPHDRGLDGHSDADVAVHALMDALLGALALGDIGRHFPDTDPKYKGADSMKLLEAVMAMVIERGFRVGNADITIVAQKPKLAGYMAQMKANIALGLNVDEDRVNVKATTTEHMGFEGEELGISSTAAVIICKQA